MAGLRNLKIPSNAGTELCHLIAKNSTYVTIFFLLFYSFVILHWCACACLSICLSVWLTELYLEDNCLREQGVVHIHTYIHTYTQIYNIHTCIHTNIYIQVLCIYIHTYIHTYTHEYVHSYMHVGSLNCTLKTIVSGSKVSWICVISLAATSVPQPSRITGAEQLYVYTYIYVLTYICGLMYICMCVYMDIWKHGYMYRCIYVHMYIFIYTFIYVYVHISVPRPSQITVAEHNYVYTYVCIYIYIYIYIHIYVYIYIYVYMYTYIYIYMYTCICIYIYIFTSILCAWLPSRPSLHRPQVLSRHFCKMQIPIKIVPPTLGMYA